MAASAAMKRKFNFYPNKNPRLARAKLIRFLAVISRAINLVILAFLAAKKASEPAAYTYNMNMHEWPHHYQHS